MLCFNYRSFILRYFWMGYNKMRFLQRCDVRVSLSQHDPVSLRLGMHRIFGHRKFSAENGPKKHFRVSAEILFFTERIRPKCCDDANRNRDLHVLVWSNMSAVRTYFRGLSHWQFSSERGTVRMKHPRLPGGGGLSSADPDSRTVARLAWMCKQHWLGCALVQGPVSIRRFNQLWVKTWTLSWLTLRW